MELELRDPIWEFAGAVISVVAIIAACWVAWWQRGSKRITYSVRSTQLLSIGTEIRDKIDITYQGQAIRDIALVEFGLKNNGNLPIQPIDFIKPIEFYFGERARILATEVSSATPNDLGVVADNSPSENPDRIVIHPLLLNSRDCFTIKSLVTGSERCTVNGRISGIHSIELEKAARSGWRELAPGGLIGVMIGAVLVSAAKIMDNVWIFPGGILMATAALFFSQRKRP